jgi:hypothetical protein
MTQPHAAPEAAIHRLVSDGILNDAQAQAVLAALAGAEPKPAEHHGWVAEVSGYLGGGVMAGGLIWVLGESWSDLSRVGRTGILAAITVLLIVAALVAAGLDLAAIASGPASTRRRIVGVLLAAAAIPVFPAVAAALDTDYMYSAGAGAAIVVAAIAYALVPNAFAVVVLAGLTVGAVISTMAELAADRGDFWLGVAFLTAGVAWGPIAAIGLIRPVPLGLSFASVFSILGAQLLFIDEGADWPAYAATAAIGALSLAAYPRLRQTVLVVAAVVAVTLAVPEALYDWSDGRLQVAYVVLIGGAVLVAASVSAMRWRRGGLPHV